MAANKFLEPSEKTSFLYQSITDMQGTIRAIDTKLGIAMVILSFNNIRLLLLRNAFSLYLHEVSHKRKLSKC